MNDDKIIEVMARAIDRASFSLVESSLAYGDKICLDYDLDSCEIARRKARAAWNAAKAERAEAVHEPLRALEAAARIAEQETLTAPNAPGWPAVCAVLRHVVELRAMLLATPDQR